MCLLYALQEVLSQVLHEAGYSKESALLLDDFIKVCLATFSYPSFPATTRKLEQSNIDM